MAGDSYLRVESEDELARITVVGRGVLVIEEADGPVDDIVGAVNVTLKGDSIAVEIVRIDEAWTGPVEVTVR